MRDLLFKNLVSSDRRKRIISSSEVMDKSGIHNIIRRHFICMVKEVKNENDANQPSPHLYVLKERKTNELKQRFFCRMKGSVYALNHGKLYLVSFLHSLRIELSALPTTLAQGDKH